MKAPKSIPLALLLCAVLLQPTFAQNGDAQGIRAELLQNIEMAEQKYVGLANVLSEEQYDWRPEEGVRSIGEVLLHIAGNNYWLPILIGHPAPEGVAISQDYQSVWDYEKQTGKDMIVKALNDSFSHLKASIKKVPEADLNNAMDIFGTPGTVRGYLVMTTTHMHEHLGQLIAYARINGVKPPWSN